MGHSSGLRRSAAVAWDIASWLVSLGAFTLLRHEFSLSERMWVYVGAYAAGAIVLQLAGGFASHLYLGRNRVGSYEEATTLAALVTAVAVIMGLVLHFFSPVYSRGVVTVIPALAFLLMAAGRWVFRAFRGTDRPRPTAGATPVIIYGAGDAGHQVARLIDTAEEAPYRIVGFVDDDQGKRYLRVRGHRVLGQGPELVRIARAQGVSEVILAISQAPPTLIRDVSEECSEAGINLLVVPPVREMIAGHVELSSLREVNVLDLLGRRPIRTNLAEIADHLSGKIVLITGAGGSIGSELARQVHRLAPARLLLLDRDESALHATQLSITGQGLLESDDTILCDIRDAAALDAVFARHLPDVVLHAAALKHLPLLERFPEEGWKTNVLGTANVLRCAAEHGARRFVNISTDKAADPSSVLGQTKRLAERLTAWYASQTGLPYLSVRFGNVLGSRGSVLDTFRAQIERGGPITLTHPDVTRYFMTIPEACELVLQASVIGESGEVMVLDMGEPVRILDVAERLIAESKRSIDIELCGLRHGEKLHEVLFGAGEGQRASRHPLISRVPVPPLAPRELGDVGRSPDLTEADLNATDAIEHVVSAQPGTPPGGHL